VKKTALTCYRWWVQAEIASCKLAFMIDCTKHATASKSAHLVYRLFSNSPGTIQNSPVWISEAFSAKALVHGFFSIRHCLFLLLSGFRKHNSI